MNLGLVTYLAATPGQDDPEARFVISAVRKHESIPELKDVEREQSAGKEDRPQREDRQALSHLIPAHHSQTLSFVTFGRRRDAGLSSPA
jgi:hypothetical protein